MSSTVGFVAAAVCLAGTFTHYGMADISVGHSFSALASFQCTADGIGIVTIDFNDFPAPSFVFLAGIFDGHILCLGRKLNVVGIIEHDEIIQPNAPAIRPEPWEISSWMPPSEI